MGRPAPRPRQWRRRGNSEDGEARLDAKSERRNGLGIDAMLVLDRYHWPSLRDSLSERVAGCERATWAESLDCLRAKFFWEYEGLERR